ncbi:MAG: ureidoglycolate lyase, partial [Pseudomonadota bacterium]
MSAGPPPTLRIERLTARAFAPFGAVLRPDPARGREINQGFATRFHDLAEIDVAAEGGRVCVSIFRATARPFPAPIEMLERHPLGAQAFAPMSRAPWLAVVAESGPDGRPDAARLRAFRAPAGVGLVYARGV